MSFAGIHFKDAQKLLAPGYSLAGLCKMTNLPNINKSVFPFGLLDSNSYLEEIILPSDPKLWYSRLSDSTPSQEIVDEALAKFSKHNFKNVADYLIFYLKADVQILRRASLLLFDSFLKQTGSHPIDCRKMTIGSLSSFAAQMFLHREKRIGFFSPTQPALYSILKKSTIGGLSEMTRSTCLPDEQSAKINSHILPNCPTDCEQTSHKTTSTSQESPGQNKCGLDSLLMKDPLLSSTFEQASHASVFYETEIDRCCCNYDKVDLCRHAPGEIQPTHGHSCHSYDIASLYASSG